MFIRVVIKIVTPYCRNGRQGNMEFLKEDTEPIEFGSEHGQSSIFDFGRGTRHNMLLLCTKDIKKEPKKTRKLVIDQRSSGLPTQSRSQKAAKQCVPFEK